MAAYVLENDYEGERLEKQNARKLYSVDMELEGIILRETDSVLDAGCGTGAVSRSILQNHRFKKLTGIDFSLARLELAKSYIDFEHNTQVIFQKEDLCNLENFNHQFDVILSRFVMHHLENPKKVIFDLASKLKQGAQMIVIDSDGILFNLFSSDKKLMDDLEKIKQQLKIDLFVGRKLKSYFTQAGLSNIETRIIPMHFTGDDLKHEKEQYIDRFQNIGELFSMILGENGAQEFTKRYIGALDDPSSELFYNKFICRGIRAF